MRFPQWPLSYTLQLVVESDGILFELSFLFMGVLLFALGTMFDFKDPERSARFSDNAFWLHLVGGSVALVGAAAMGNLFDGEFHPMKALEWAFLLLIVLACGAVS